MPIVVSRGIPALLFLSALIAASDVRAQNDDSNQAAAPQWPTWRGPRSTGVAPQATPPTVWSETRSIRWKKPIPGLAHASPIVSGDRVFIQTAVPKDEASEGYAFQLVAVNRADGNHIWTRTLCEAVPHESGHRDASQASNSPCTDGNHIYAYFGSRGLYCVAWDGTVVWQKNLGTMQTRREFGEGSSPALYDDTLVIQWDHEGSDFVVALDKKTGAERWRKSRTEPTSWATPVVVDAGERAQVITSAPNFVRAYDLQDGELIWKCGGMTQNTIPTPMYSDELVYALSGFRGNAALAIRYRGARGDLTSTDAVAWRYDGKGTPYVPSGVLYDGKLYFLSGNRAQLTCLDAKTGHVYYDRERIEGLRDVYASLVAANRHIYVVGRDGKMAVVRHGPRPEVVAVNALDDRFDASPALVGDALYLRGHRYLYCVGE